MTKSFRPILTQLLWLTVAFIVTILICRFVFFWDFGNGTLDLHLHDTYFVFSAAKIVAPIFLLLIFLLYFIKEIRKKFGRALPNIILLIAGLFLIILIASVNKEFIRLGTISGWTSYPALSAVSNDEPETAELNPSAAVLTNALTVLQLIVTTALLYATFRWGRQTKQSS